MMRSTAPTETVTWELPLQMSWTSRHVIASAQGNMCYHVRTYLICDSIHNFFSFYFFLPLLVMVHVSSLHMTHTRRNASSRFFPVALLALLTCQERIHAAWFLDGKPAQLETIQWVRIRRFMKKESATH